MRIVMGTLQFLAVLGLLVVYCESQNKTETIVPQPNSTVGLGNTSDDKSTGSAFQERYPHYQLEPDDVLDLVFEFSPEFNQTVTVQPDGYISLRGVGEMQVKGLTVPQLREALQKAYAQFLHDPAIGIVLKDFEKPYFVAGGRVARPGKYDLRGDTTVTEAVAVAGGFLDTAKHSQVLLFHRVSEGWAEVKVLDVKKMMNSRSLTEDVHLRPGDMIFVPQNRLSKIERFLPIPKAMGNVTLNPAQY